MPTIKPRNGTDILRKIVSPSDVYKRERISAATPTLSNHVKLDKWNCAKPIQKNRRIFSCFHYIQIMSSWMCVFSFLWWSLWFMLIIKWLSGRVSRSQTISLLAFVASLVSLCALLFFCHSMERKNVSRFLVNVQDQDTYTSK